MNRQNDGCTCVDFTGRSQDGLLHACGTILCEFHEGFMNGFNLLKEEETKDTSSEK